MSNTNKYCCYTMAKYINDPNESLVGYLPEIRQYWFILHYNNRASEVRQPLLYCPWCGTELPSVLSDEWEEILETDYGILAKDWNDDSKIPPEFKTDEWWKKRGL